MTEQPNIVLVSIDSLRADHCGFMGHDRDTTPTLDRMAENGLTFENAVAPGPSTPESMPAIFTGHYPTDRGASEGAELVARRERIRQHMAARDTIPERLSRRGYTTAAFTPNPFTSRHFGFEKGFDYFRDFMGESRTGGNLYERVFNGFLEGGTASSMARMLVNFWQREEVFKPWETYYEDVVDWVQAVSEPYFLWVFLMDAHNPYMAGGQYRTQSRLASFHANYRFWRESHETPFSPSVHERLVTAYDDAVRYADAFLKRLRSDLAADDPTFVVHADHGEAFGEHGTYGHEPYLYEENVHVPLVIASGTDGTITTPVSLRSLPDLLGNLADDDAASLHSDKPYVISRTAQGSKVGVHGHRWRYIRGRDGNEFSLLDGAMSADSTGETLREIAADLVENWTEVEAERERLAAAASVIDTRRSS